ncbi:putative dipeptidase [Clostridiales bacterium 1_7_47FAA]|uniref:Sapep family Mn(2+)-dependent dipeptidase n=1 Tax=Enterocloster hominis (ex Hitch et al. 2024) TaxID=1917870 RepID=A0ABV1D3G1_9FIRM|nr:putative dipeptidase [Clostridiales bacterium 1_7_47FAA]
MFKPDSSLMQEIDQWIEKNKEAFVKDLDRLVAVPSISVHGDDTYPYGKECGRVLDEMTALAAGYGFQVKNHEYHCGSLLVKGTGDSPRRIGIYAHLDVVPLGEGWHNPPLKCTQKDGFLIGRGVGDNKGPGICALYALRYLKEHGIELKNDVLVYYGLSEETGMQDIEYFCRTQQVPDFNLVADTNFPVCYGEKGLMRADIERKIEGNLVSFHGGSVVNVIPPKAEAVISGVSLEAAREKLGDIEGISVDRDGESVKVTALGISRHAAFPEGSVNAIQELSKALAGSGLLTGSAAHGVKAVAAMTSDYYGESCGIPFEDKESGRLTCVGSVIHAQDGVMKVSFDTRYPVTVDGDEVVDGFKKRAESLGFAVSVGELSAPAYVPLDNPYIPVLSEICDCVQGKHYEPYTMGGGTYSRHLPCAIGFGPGVPDAPNPFENGHGQGHQPDECVPFDMLLKGLKTYIISLLELDCML